MGNVIILGSQWGDEGKGKIVDWLSERADMVVRFQGGHNAGHTLVIDGKTLKPLNLKDAPGNFYLKPNGVFFIDGKGGHIVPSTEYEAHPPAGPRLAVQSGPLLLHNGKVHPAFRADSTNRLHRNGVGVRKDGKVVFAITEFEQAKRVTLYEFAEFFRSQGCENALFLDGDISRMFIDHEGPMVPGNFYGTIFAVTAPAK